MRHIPNLICVARILLVWPIVHALYAANYDAAIVLFFIASASDGLDGYLAKRFSWTSTLGKYLDPLADKVLLIAVFVSCAWLGLVPRWLAATAVARDVMIGLGAVVFTLWFGPLRGRPTVLSKVNTAVQLSYLLFVMLYQAFGIPSQEILSALAIIALLTTLLSGVDYVMVFTRRAWALPAPSA
ncbi:MAG TPA: CDP-alcohol phosphatidyltransferase family protein [Steroidobacteraceae bacterium]|nr:CDP-alcohol phosphatidyltransferase family protein [Steroidobacteraceae bacterium]